MVVYENEYAPAVKDYEAFERKKGVCYIPEYGDVGYEYNDYLKIAKGNERLAKALFDLSEWQHPETLFQEGIIEGEWDENGNLNPELWNKAN